MSDRVVCDECGEDIDQSVAYFTANVQGVQITDGVLTSTGQIQKLDWHAEHVPGQLSGEAAPAAAE